MRRIGLAALAATGLLAGCTPVAWYQPPATEAPATFTGSRIERPPLVADQRVFLQAVDGAPVKGLPDAYDQPVPVAPGPHMIQLGYAQGYQAGQIALRFEVAPAKQYVVRFEKPPGPYATLWLDDAATGQPASDRLAVPVMASSTSVVPVFVPRGK